MVWRRWQLGGGSLAAAAWQRWQCFGGAQRKGGGSLAAEQLRSVAIARRRWRQLGSGSLAAAAWRGGGDSVAAMAAAEWWRRTA
jgi:hypothetical protein